MEPLIGFCTNAIVYRVIYIIDDDKNVVDVAIVRLRSEAYR